MTDLPNDQLVATHWLVSPVGGAEIENLDELFDGGVCGECLIPFGKRTRRRMRVRFGDALSRRADANRVGLAERPKGPTFTLLSPTFLSLLSGADRKRFTWRAVEIANPTKTTSEQFELVASKTHAPYVALEGGEPDVTHCSACNRTSPPRYALVTDLPRWLNNGGDPVYRGQPKEFVAATALAPSVPDWFTVGDWAWGVDLAVSYDRVGPEPLLNGVKGMPRLEGVKGIHLWPVGVVSQRDPNAQA